MRDRYSEHTDIKDVAGLDAENRQVGFMAPHGAVGTPGSGPNGSVPGDVEMSAWSAVEAGFACHPTWAELIKPGSVRNFFFGRERTPRTVLYRHHQVTAPFELLARDDLSDGGYFSRGWTC